MAFDAEGARKAGYSESEIVDFLGNQSKFDVAGARKSGYSDAEIIQHLTASTAAKTDIPKPSVTVPKQGLGDKVKGMLNEGVDNLATELQNPVKAGQNAVLGVGKGIVDAVDGGAQLLSRGVAGGVHKFFPDSAADKLMQGEVKKVETYNKDREDRYQAATKGSVLAGVGRAGGSVAIPLNGLSKLERGASLAAKVRGGAATGTIAGALQPVYGDEDKAPSAFVKDKLIQMGGGAALGGAAPVVGKVGLEAASKLGSKTAEDSLTRARMVQMFDKSPNAKADAEIIKDFGGVKERIGNRKLLTGELNARSQKYFDDAYNAAKEAGATPEQLRALVNWRGLTKAEQDALRNGPVGTAIADISQKLDRVRNLTPGELSSNIGGVPRSLVDAGGPEAALAVATGGKSAGLPTGVRYAIKNLLGGRETRNAAANKLLDDRSQRAAALYLSENGGSEATKGLGVLEQVTTDKARLNNAQAAQGAKEQAALELKARKVSRTPGGGAYEALLEHTGLSPDDLNKALRIAQNIPEASKAVKAIRVDGSTTKDGAIYPLTNIIRKVADDMGMQRQGALTQTMPAGALSGIPSTPVDAQRSLNHAAAVKVRQSAYKDAEKAASGLGSAEARKAAKTVAQKLVSTRDAAERLKLIDDLEAKHPEAQGLFDTVRHFK